MIDPVFAAIAAAREAHARFERAVRTENFTVDVSLREALRELAATVPTTVAGVAAHHRFCARNDARARLQLFRALAGAGRRSR